MRLSAPFAAALVLGLLMAGCGRNTLGTQVVSANGATTKAIGCLPGDCGSIIRPTPRPCGPRAQGTTDAILPPGVGGGGSYPGGGCGCGGPRTQSGTDAYMPPGGGVYPGNPGSPSYPKPPCR